MPNGQAAFLFLLTSALAPLIRLSYGRMVIMALPYTLVMTLTGYLMVHFFWRISLIIFTKRVRFSIIKLRRRLHLKRIVI